MTALILNWFVWNRTVLHLTESKKNVFKPLNNFLNKWLYLFETELFEIELFYIWLNLNKYVFKPMNEFLNKWLYLF